MENPRFDPLITELLQLLKETRHAKGLSHQQLADKAGINRSTVSLLESRKRNPTIQLAGKLAEALGCKLSDLIKKAEMRAKRHG